MRFLLLLLLLFHLYESVLVVPVGTVVTGNVCPPPFNIYSDHNCVRTIPEGIAYSTAHGDPFVSVLGSTYAINSIDPDVGVTELILITTPMTIQPFTPYNTQNHVNVVLMSSPTFRYGVVIDSDNVHINHISFSAHFNLQALIVINDSMAMKKRDGYEFYGSEAADWDFLNQLHYQDTRDFIDDAFESNEVSCLDCFCGCGVTPVPTFVRTGIVLVNNTFTGMGGPLLSINGTFGINNTVIQFNSFLSSDPDIIDMYINTNFINTTDLTMNYYGPCEYPNVIITFCQDTSIYLPYFTDSAFLYPGPVAVQYSSSNITWYNDLVAAYAAGNNGTATNVSVVVRGILPIDNQVVANGPRLFITSTTVASCCPVLKVRDGLNPALYSIYPNIYLSDIRVMMGVDSGLLLTRSGFPLQSNFFVLFNASSESGLISAATLLPPSEVTRLGQSITTTSIPNPLTFRQTLLHHVNIKATVPGTSYKYAVLSFIIIQNNLFNNFVVENSMIEDAEVGIASSQVQFNIINNFFDCVNTSIAIQLGSSLINFNKFLSRANSQTLVLLGNPNNVAFTNNIIILFSEIITPTFPARPPNNYTGDYNTILADDPRWYQEVDNINSTSVPMILQLGPGAPDTETFLSVVFSNYTRSCSYDIKVFYVPLPQWNPLYFGETSVFAYSGPLDNFTIATFREDTNLLNLTCQNFVLYSLFGNSGALTVAPTFSLNNPTLTVPDDRICSGGIMTYAATFNNLNENYYFANIPPITTGIITTGPTTASTTLTTASTTITTASTTITTASTTLTTASSTASGTGVTVNSTTVILTASTTGGPVENPITFPVWAIILIILVAGLLLFLLVLLCFYCGVDRRRRRRNTQYVPVAPFAYPSTETVFSGAKSSNRDTKRSKRFKGI